MDSTNKFLVPLAIIVAGIIIGGAVYLNRNNPGPTKTPTGSSNITVPAVTSADHILGNPNADVVIVEYSDTECPYCKLFQTTMNRIMTEYGAGGRVAWVYRNSPIVQLHPKAPKEAEAVECVAELAGNETYWKFLDKVYEVTPSNNGLDPAELPKIAGQLGVDVAKFNTCWNSGKYAQKVEKGVQEAITATNGQLGTPFSILITKDGSKFPISGAQPYEAVKALIDTALNNTPATATTTSTN